MNLGNILLAAMLGLIPAAALAHPLYLTGTVGEAPVIAMIERDGDALSGWYLYFNHAKLIQLSGRIDTQGHLRLEETVSSHVNATFEGAADRDQWTGVWRSEASKSSLPFRLHENRDLLASLDGKFSCSVKKVEKGIGPSYHEIDLRIAKGQVTRFTNNRGITPKGEGTQSCSMDMEALSQIKSDSGILLKSKKTDAASQDERRCTVRIVGDGRHLFVQMGDWTEQNNDCRRMDDEMYCSPRAFWADIIVDQTTGTCKTVE